jgi:nucleotide-binding universal stress UspA family protein
LTLNRKHRDYEYTRRSRTFLCGTDTNDYSDTALEWLIDELVDDGDEVVCLRVVEKDSREAVKWAGGQGEKGYRKEAERFLEAIEKKNTEDRAISLILEFSIGKIQETIQQMIRIYEPAMLVVGTRGRSLTGYHGLLSSGSVSKYCLQYSPVPVIVVRPSSKREAKKRKRLQDPSRTGYRDILDKSDDAPRGRGWHLLDAQNRMSVVGSDLGALGSFDNAGDPDHEARMVAEAVGYRGTTAAAAPPPSSATGREGGTSSSLSRITSTTSTDGTNDASPMESVLKSPSLRDVESPVPSDDELDDDDDDEEIGMLEESTVMRPEDEAAMLAYERAQKIFEEEQVEAVERARKDRDRKDRSVSRGAKPGSRNASRRRESGEEGGGAAVLGLLAQLDRGVK